MLNAAKLSIILMLFQWIPVLGTHSIPTGKEPASDSTNTHSAYKRVYNTERITGNIPIIDGQLNDDCWQLGSWSETFTQQMPQENIAASEKTMLKIFYDDKYIYVAIRAFESDIAKIHRYFGKRDAFEGDVVGVCFDSYYDQRFGYEFDLTAAGGQVDLVLDNNGNPDFNWNAVWDGATAIEDSAWTAEMRIPLSQLRFNNKETQVWGMHAWRWINRLQEEDQWSLIPRNNSGIIYNFGELHGIDKINYKQRFELIPYSVGKTISSKKEAQNPFATGFEKSLTVGLDGKIGIGSDFTADFSINPDFGQVEADPSVMNLSAFETYYDEKRPFFLEGKNILNYSLDGDQLFYSRRIGHSPWYSPSVDNSKQEYYKKPENTSIISAVKLSGKTAKGLSIGFLQGLTALENVEISKPAEKYKETAEPLSNYIVTRVQKDYNKGNTVIGGIFTASNRFFSESHLQELNKSAYTAGVDVNKYLFNRNYFVNFKTIISRVNGDEKAIIKLQQSSAHYFQRPDAKYLSIDSSLTSLTGTGGYLAFGREGDNKLRFRTTFNWRSPGLDLNDLGFMQQADNLRQMINVSWVENVPKSLFRSYRIYIEEGSKWTYGGEHSETYFKISGSGQFKNKYSIYGHAIRFIKGFDPRILRGGPGLKQDPYWCLNGNVNTDNSKPFSAYFSVHSHQYSEEYSSLYDFYPGINIRLSSQYSFSAEFSYSQFHNATQYVKSSESNDTKVYIMGNLSQKTAGLTFRFNAIFTPKLSVQYYGSPFISTGKYSKFKKVTNPLAGEYNQRFYSYPLSEIQYNSADNKYTIADPSGNNYQFDNPNFSFREFKSNLVAKWEFRPGSFLYLVWSHNRSGRSAYYETSASENLSELFNIYPTNIFLIKLNYYFSI